MEQKKTFQEIINRDQLTLVDFFATWCGPCQMMQPILQELSSRISDRASIIKVDVDRAPEAANAFRIQGVPTLILFRRGEILWRQSGVLNANQLEDVINKFSVETVKN
ncbi:MAG: thioredoxin [Flammeovirgaceae bacterium]|nr:thioredoxin [Flammeovirgaceae bacterium]